MILTRLPVTAMLGSSLFLIGMSAAAVAPYRAIIAIENLGMSNALYALVITLGSVGTALSSLVLGYFSDRVSDRRRLIVFCSALGALAYGLVYTVPSQLSYILAFCVILPFGGALFSQTFSFSRAFYNRQNPARAEFIMSALRTLFAVSWVVVPPLAGFIASTYSVFDVFAAAALAHLGCTLIFGLLLTTQGAKVGPSTTTSGGGGAAAGLALIPTARRFGIVGVTLMRVAMALHATVLPLILTNEFGGTLTDVGLNASLAAGLEVPCMLAWGWAAGRLRKETILSFNALLYALYLLLVFFAGSVTEVLWLQGLNAVATAALLSLTISYMQEAITGQVGLSTSLMDVTTVLATFGAAALFAALSSAFGYAVVFIAASLVSLLGAGMFFLSRAPTFSARRSERAGAD